ncbi:MAG: HEAT repeat domain-containing protein [Planctomycetes bacterium]|nr:HEAT repeat domain-containing protein [Planctomycetota bacterium]
MGPTVCERIVTMLRELARTAEDLPRCDTEVRRARAAEAYNLLAARLTEVGGAGEGLDEALAAALGDRDPGVRVEALKAMARRRRAEAGPVACGALTDDAEPVRLEAARALAVLAAPITAPHLARAAAADPASSVRGEALRALLRADRGRALEVFAEVAPEVEESALAVARARFDAARRRWGQRAVRHLVPLLRHASAAVRRGAASSLGHTDSAEAVMPLVAALADTSVPVRLEAARSLGAIGDPRALPRLSGALHDPDHLVRGFVAEALGRIGAAAADASVLAPLATALVDPAPAVRQQAVASFGRIAERQRERGWACAPLLRQLIIDALAVALTDVEAKVVAAAARLAGSLQDPRLIRPLLGALSHPEAFRGVYEPVLAALRRMGAAAEGPVLRALRDPEPRLRARVAQLVGALSLPGGPGALMEALGDPVPGVRAAAAAALGEQREGRALGLLLVALRDPDADVCARAAQALGRLGDPRAVPALAQVAADLSKRTRGDTRRLERPAYAVLAAAIEALGALRDERALAALVQSLTHGDWRVRRDAADALGRLGQAEACEALSTALFDDERLVRRSAASALRALKV